MVMCRTSNQTLSVKSKWVINVKYGVRGYHTRMQTVKLPWKVGCKRAKPVDKKHGERCKSMGPSEIHSFRSEFEFGFEFEFEFEFDAGVTPDLQVNAIRLRPYGIW